MNDVRTILERGYAGATPPPDGFERMLRRRDRKRRNQRIAAGVVGIAMFVAALWIVTSFGPLDRSDTSVVPGGGVTGPAETGPAETGPAATGPTESDPYAYYPDEYYIGLPPEGAQPSSPRRSELIAETRAMHVGWVYVFEDGTVISWSEGTPEAPVPFGYREQRLTPEGVDLVRSGDIDPAAFICYERLTPECRNHRLEVPAGAWEDSTLRLYVPYRYAVCAGPLRKFPAAAQDLLLGKEATFEVRYDYDVERWECFDLTTAEARALDATLADAGFDVGNTIPGRLDGPGFASYERWLGEDPEASAQFRPILPHGTFGVQGGG